MDVERMGAGRRRVVLGAAALATVGVGLGVTLGGSGTWADAAGGVLYAVLVYLVCAVVAPRARRWRVGLVALALCVGVELLQLTGFSAAVVDLLPWARLVLGTTFNAWDLLAYAVGAALAAAGDQACATVRAGTMRPDPFRPARRGGAHGAGRAPSRTRR